MLRLLPTQRLGRRDVGADRPTVAAWRLGPAALWRRADAEWRITVNGVARIDRDGDRATPTIRCSPTPSAIQVPPRGYWRRDMGRIGALAEN